MDLKCFILQHIRSKTLGNIKDGFEKSSFVENVTDGSKLLKDIITALLLGANSKQKIHNQLQSGGLATTKPAKNDNKKQSFCTEFNQMVNNLFGLLGFEFSKYLFVLFGAHLIIRQHIDEMSTANNYDEILTHVNYIYNFMTLKESSDVDAISAIELSQEFIDSLPENHETNNHNYSSIILKGKSIHTLFGSMIEEIKELHASNNIIMLDDNKLRWYEQLSDMLDNAKLNGYNVNNIDDLCMNLGMRNVGYDRSFLKMFEILYKESFADIPYELWNDYKPHLQFVENELKLDVKCSKYLNSFAGYYRHIYDETLKSVQEKLAQKYILNVNITDKCYDLLSDITFNLLIHIAKKIACSQITSMYFGKSARVQFIQVFQGVLDCAPRLYSFTKSQREILHYILLPRKIIMDAIVIVQEMKQKDIDEVLNSAE